MTSSCSRLAAMCIATSVLAASTAVLPAVAQSAEAGVSTQSAPAFSALTVPAGSLTDGCQLTPPPPEPTPIPQPEGGVIAIAPKPFGPRRFPSNPWFGTDSKLVAEVRTAVERVPRVHLPDGPPLERKEAAKLLWTVKGNIGNISEAYRASYETTFVGPILVQAVRYTDAKWATPEGGRIVRGSTVILVTGNPQGECFKAVRHYIESLK